MNIYIYVHIYTAHTLLRMLQHTVVVCVCVPVCYYSTHAYIYVHAYTAHTLLCTLQHTVVVCVCACYYVIIERIYIYICACIYSAHTTTYVKL